MCACARRMLRRHGLLRSAHDDLGVDRVRGRAVRTEADEFYADTFGVMARDAPGELADQYELPDGRLDLGLERNAADREILDLALDGRAVAAREPGERVGGDAFVAAQIAIADQCLVHQQCELLGGALALERRARE